MAKNIHCSRCCPREGCQYCKGKNEKEGPPDYNDSLYPQDGAEHDGSTCAATKGEAKDSINPCDDCPGTIDSMKDGPGIKHDAGKLRLDLIDPLMEEYLALALGYGAKKYDEANWLRGVQWSRVYGALRRHLRDWYMGEDIDPESGNPHLAHAAAMLQFLVRYSVDERFEEYDDRLFVEELEATE